MKVLVLPDIHGRDFWRKPCEDIDEYDKVVFLGDYLDPYDFEGITVEAAIDNFKDILLFAKDNPKVVMLLGNHDMPYFSETYYGFDSYHCRHSTIHHKEICGIFKEHEDLFRIAYHENNVLFTHAGCSSEWLSFVFGDKYNKEIDLDELCTDLNGLLKTTQGLLNLYMISRLRGGFDEYGSCIWADDDELFSDRYKQTDCTAIFNVNQVFGHTIQVFRKNPRIIEVGSKILSIVDDGLEFGDMIQVGNLKMIDTANAYVLDTDKFIIIKLPRNEVKTD